MAINFLGPPRITGPAESQLRALRSWLSQLYQGLTQTNTEARLARLEQAMATINELGLLTQTISASPTQAEVQMVQAKVNAVILAAGLPDLDT